MPILFCEKHKDCESRKNHKWTNCSTPVCFKINAEATKTPHPLVSTEAPCCAPDLDVIKAAHEAVINSLKSAYAYPEHSNGRERYLMMHRSATETWDKILEICRKA